MTVRELIDLLQKQPLHAEVSLMVDCDVAVVTTVTFLDADEGPDYWRPKTVMLSDGR